MKWPARVQIIVDTLAAGVPHSAPDEIRRVVTQKIAEQCRFEFGTNWGWKRSGPHNPNSTDVFCTRSPFIGWDWSVPSGIAQFPESIDLTGQLFVEVDPVDHLGAASPVPVPEPPPIPPPIPPPDDLQARVLQLEAEIRLHEAIQRDLYRWIATKVSEPLPNYLGEGRVPWFGGRVVVRSKPEP